MSPEAVYDALMAQIEPDLMLANLPTLAKVYARETEDERKQREAKHALAFLLLDDCLSELNWVFEQDARELDQAVQDIVQAVEAQEYRDGMNVIENHFDDYNSPA